MKNNHPLILEKKPAHFRESFSVSSVYCLWKNKFLLLKRHPEKLAGDSWCLPGGKKEKGETPHQGAIRELKEETGITLPEDEISFLGTLYMQIPDCHYSFYLYGKKFEMVPVLDLNLEESIEARWVSLKEARSLPIINNSYPILEYCTERFSS